MSGSNNALGKLTDRVFPKMPDFYKLMNDQCDVTLAATDALVQFMVAGEEQWALKVRELEHEGDRVRDTNMDVLNSAFATPMDREEIFRAFNTIDQVANYAKTTVREMETLGLKPDSFMQEMAGYLKDGAEALQAGYAALKTNPHVAEPHSAAARKAERNIEKCYRRALAELFDIESDIKSMEVMDRHTGPQALIRVIDMFKHREIYRHLANAGDRVAEAGEALRDIIVKIV